jgi:CRP-like cAMP-binding protein
MWLKSHFWSMKETDVLKYALNSFAGLDEANFALSEPYWELKVFEQKEFYNKQRQICKYLGFIIDGVFRSYYLEEKTGKEKNVFFFTEQQIVVAFKSFVTQTPCNYYTQAMTPATILFIHVDHLNLLYQQSQQWERFGRLVAEHGFNIAMARTESFLFQNPKQRYLDLIQLHPNIFNSVPLYQISSYLDIQGPSLSRIRKKLSEK